MLSEVAEGWLFEVEPLEAAQRQWGARVAVGKLSIVRAANRKPRLVLDSLICNTNALCQLPERFQLPALASVRHSFPLRGSNSPIGGFSLDVKAAHKTVRVRQRDQGMLGLQMDSRFFFYRVCPFGAGFSAFWFQRVSAFFIRHTEKCAQRGVHVLVKAVQPGFGHPK